VHQLMQRRDVSRTGDTKTTAEIVEGGDAEVLAGFEQAREGVAGLPTLIPPGAAGISNAFETTKPDIIKRNTCPECKRMTDEHVASPITWRCRSRTAPAGRPGRPEPMLSMPDEAANARKPS
jgi:hypothetical protein